ncbi:MAG: methylated-DNA--[protein]-cysteine S-methyltransferase [Oscillospiraceae bacterium]|nr:methylated-DNA--[protein]-cysteine S-methyltransferase [Oscillospiraceae bacterium]
MNFIKFKSPFGVIGIEEKNGSVSRVYLPGQKPDLPENPGGFLERAKQQFEEYFAGRRTVFELPLSFDNCTDFKKLVYSELLNVKYGETASYKDIAERIGNPEACRAVGLANNKNPLPIIVPCHRIIGSNGKLTGYAGGLELKEQLLKLERK